MWLGLCPLSAVATSWPVALTLAICLLVTITLTAGGLALLRRAVKPALHLPLAALLAGTLAVLEQLALAAWWPDVDATVAPWLVLVASLAVLVCLQQMPVHDSGSRPIPGRDDEQAVHAFVSSAKLALALSAALLAIGVARDGFWRVFLLADTPIGALVLLALLLAAINFVMRGSTGSSHLPALSPLGPDLRRDDEQSPSAPGLHRDDERK